jgi:hypothetical protein
VYGLVRLVVHGMLGRTVEHALVEPGRAPAPETLEARLAALISFYRWQEAVFSVPAAGRLMRGRPRRASARGLFAHLDARTDPAPSSLVRVRNHRHHGRPPLLLPAEIQAILDGCVRPDASVGDWVGNLRDRLLFALLAETGMRLGAARVPATTTGRDAAKKVPARKRALAVDVTGLVIAVVVSPPHTRTPPGSCC